MEEKGVRGGVRGKRSVAMPSFSLLSISSVPSITLLDAIDVISNPLRLNRYNLSKAPKSSLLRGRRWHILVWMAHISVAWMSHVSAGDTC